MLSILEEYVGSSIIEKRKIYFCTIYIQYNFTQKNNYDMPYKFEMDPISQIKLNTWI